MPITAEPRTEWGVYGEYGADKSPANKHGGLALADAIEEAIRDQVLRGGVKSPPSSRRGLAGRLNYLNSPAGRHMLRDNGITQTKDTIRRWRTGRQIPRADDLQRIDDAFWLLRDRNVRRNLNWLRRRGESGDIALEIYPVDQSSVIHTRRRNIPDVGTSDEVREKKISPGQWTAAVDAFENGDEQGLRDTWEHIISDIDSDWRSYIYVSHVGLIGA
ncbi:hypothetical protein AB0942_09515 [Streptomyces nodosus]|uniref:hypothetical protein n=1 Tax=Streptomyces nodosus TaxID=40318 RepID=UPI003455B5BA